MQWEYDARREYRLQLRPAVGREGDTIRLEAGEDVPDCDWADTLADVVGRMSEAAGAAERRRASG